MDELKTFSSVKQDGNIPVLTRNTLESVGSVHYSSVFKVRAFIVLVLFFFIFFGCIDIT